jgi:oxaloacetate decarboxylase alpha subunit
VRVTYEVEGRTVTAEVVRDAGRLIVTLDTASHVVEPISASGSAVAFRLDGRPVTALVASGRGEVAVALARATVRLRPAREAPRAGAAGRPSGVRGAEEVKAPMAGRVLRLLVEEGRAVAAGAVVAVLEAMKTETEVAAGRDGVVRRVRVAPGDVVSPGDVLLNIGDPPAAG